MAINPRSRRTFLWLIWLARIALSGVFLAAGTAKLVGVEPLVELFDQIGLGQWFRYLTGALEIAGAVLLLVPRFGVVGGALLSAIMVGAFITNIVLGNNPAGAVVLFFASAAIAWALRRT